MSRVHVLNPFTCGHASAQHQLRWAVKSLLQSSHRPSVPTAFPLKVHFPPPTRQGEPWKTSRTSAHHQKQKKHHDCVRASLRSRVISSHGPLIHVVKVLAHPPWVYLDLLTPSSSLSLHLLRAVCISWSLLPGNQHQFNLSLCVSTH